MKKINNRVMETDKYDGTSMAKQRLLNLFLITDLNIKEFCDMNLKYKKYISKTLNMIEKDRLIDELPYYSDISNRVIKITELDNVLSLSRLLFNVLSSFDAFIGYIYSSNKRQWVAFDELKNIFSLLEPLFTAKTIDTHQDFDMLELLHETRNAFIHNGKYVSKLGLIEDNVTKQAVPALVIIPSEIFNEKYCKEHNIVKEYVIDTYEIFNVFAGVFKKVGEQLEKIISNERRNLC